MLNILALSSYHRGRALRIDKFADIVCVKVEACTCTICDLMSAFTEVSETGIVIIPDSAIMLQSAGTSLVMANVLL